MSAAKITAADRQEGARQFLAGLTDDDLAGANVERVRYACRVTWPQAQQLLTAELLRRGLITLRDLTPAQRRDMVDPENLDLRAIAAGPIMDPARLYLPAGMISAAAAAARDRVEMERLK